MPSISIEGDEITAISDEGVQKSIKLSDFVDRLAPSVPDTSGVVLPDGVKCAIPHPGGVTLVHQSAPRVHGFKWISTDSKSEFGPGTTYRDVRLALPYVIVLAVFGVRRGGLPTLTPRNECFFSNQPLDMQGLETPLCYPALLNCSKIPDENQSALSWICTQHLPPETEKFSSPEAAYRAWLGGLLRHLLESAFNRSSEHHEGESGFGASIEAGIDPRLASVEDWEKASHENPLFVLDVNWLPVGKTLGKVVARVAKRRRPRGADDIARLILNVRNPRRTK